MPAPICSHPSIFPILPTSFGIFLECLQNSPYPLQFSSPHHLTQVISQNLAPFPCTLPISSHHQQSIVKEKQNNIYHAVPYYLQATWQYTPPWISNRELCHFERSQVSGADRQSSKAQSICHCFSKWKGGHLPWKWKDYKISLDLLRRLWSINHYTFCCSVRIVSLINKERNKEERKKAWTLPWEDCTGIFSEPGLREGKKKNQSWCHPATRKKINAMDDIPS